jgi:hypothetical protein
MSEITMKQVMNVMCQVVGEFGVDHVYTKINDTCLNWDKEKDCPSCLVGHVLHRVGISREFLIEHSTDGVASVLFYFKWDIGIRVEEGVSSILGVAQNEQDAGNTWGYALGRALKEYDTISRRSAT